MPPAAAVTIRPPAPKAGHEGEADLLIRSIVHALRRASGWTRALAAGCIVALGLSVLVPVTTASASSPPPSQASAITAIVRNAMTTYQLRAVIVRVTEGNKVVLTRAFGTSMDGVPATTAMHFRNGAVAFAYVSTLLLEYVDQHKVSLNETIDHWLPSLPESNRVTLKMLANQTTGYPDYETDPAWLAAFNNDPFHIFTYQERLQYAFARPLQFAPGTNWSYAHTNFMILGEILSMVGQGPSGDFAPAQRSGTDGVEPDRRVQLLVHPESGPALVQLRTTRCDRDPVGQPVLRGVDVLECLLGNPRRRLGDDQHLRHGQDGRRGRHGLPPDEVELPRHDRSQPARIRAEAGGLRAVLLHAGPGYNYGLGVVRSGSWILQNPLLGGYSATEAYLPSKRISIAVATTFEPGAFDCQGNYANSSDVLFRMIGASVAPTSAPPKTAAPPPTGCT